MTALFVWTLIGASKKEGNGVVVEAVARFNFTFTLSTPFYMLIINVFLTSLQVRDEYRTDYDPDILFLLSYIEMVIFDFSVYLSMFFL